MEGVTLSTVAQDLPAQLPSACLPLPSPHLLAVSDQKRPTRATPVPARAPSQPLGNIPDGTPAGQRAKTFADPLAASVPPVMTGGAGGHVGCSGPLSLELLPKTRPGLDPRGWEGHVQYLEGFLGAVGGLGTEAFPMYSIYVPF